MDNDIQDYLPIVIFRGDTLYLNVNLIQSIKLGTKILK